MNRIFATFDNTDIFPLTLDRTATYIVIRNSDAVLPLEVKVNTDYERTLTVPVGPQEAFSGEIEQFREIELGAVSAKFNILVGV